MKKPEPKLHHFLPQNCYFNAFAAPELLNNKLAIWVHTANQQPLCQQIEKTGAIKEIYSIRDVHVRFNRELENILERIESKLAPIIKKLIKQKSDDDFSYLEKEAIATFVAMMKVRTPWHKGLLTDVFSKLRQVIALRKTNENPTGILEKIVDKDHASKLRCDTESISDEKLSNFEDFLSINNPFSHSLLSQLKINAKIIYEQMQWGFTLSHPEIPFITCDNPVACCREDHTQVGVGLAFPDVTIYFAVSPKIAFYGYKDPTIGVHRSIPTPVTQLNKEETQLFNSRTAISASKYLYSADRDIDSKLQTILDKKSALGLFSWQR
ncbi:DUF4238 domain-containing protein [Patescibacteria group bacterium]|nr:DUF4238 domain-containing protein [Patescibacteria group bacterium]